MWERACSRRRRFSQLVQWLPHRFREQARSHKKSAQGPICPTGSGARFESAHLPLNPIPAILLRCVNP
ncbi:hypothetical protein PspCFBP13508_23385 [Pseudomonas sp. CFBP13508]|nr:hypothetical protein PspCFBP13508_23385 [Pseudomonas sp. CFBP13508]